ncbi:MAG: UDP-glucose 4-epimerase GalE [Candidatus Dojkabacteria bacterium]|jgi:UDP-glucose 4-epimerase|nr:UDP-glucose 4-epimerase GalE [Candidatus Dojkabacteria bacterium]MDD4561390.1 UDP-glucose 4-epimerase GalE [Candidatus Dojkabacteria bacterium]
MKILVTGGCGYIGSNTVLELLRNNYEVRIIDNLENSKKEIVNTIKEVSKKDVEFVKGDLRNIKDVQSAIKGVDGVIHFAAYKSVLDSLQEPLRYFENNVIGTYNLVSCMKESDVKKIVFSSSAAVYGNPKNIPVTEKDEISPMSPYGRNKYCMELLLEDATHIGINYIALRYFNASGAHSSGKLGEDPEAMGNLIPRVFKASKGEYHLMIRGDKYETRDGTGIRDYVHVSDLASGHVKALEWMIKNEKSNIFNLCSGTGTTVMEIVKGVERVTGRKVDYEIVDSDPNEAVVVTGSYEKASKVLNWKPERGIDTILEDVNRWYSNC